jgi:hypothetical protein
MPLMRHAQPQTAWMAVVATAFLLLLGGCQPAPTATEVDQDRAVEIARAFVVAGQPPDFVFLELTNDPPQPSGRTWRIKVDAHVRIPQSPPAESFLHFVIDVDRSTGVPTIFAQG